MLDLAPYVDLALVWGGLIAVAVYLYVMLDGFDLGVGILFPFAPSDKCRDKMMNSIAPFWDGNETWLVLGGGGLFAAFPLAYAIVMPALYMPLILMLIALIFRGVAFEFRFKASLQNRYIWDMCFHYGSLFAAFSQGMILGAIVQGFAVEDRQFAGGAFDWLTAFSMMTGMAVTVGYAMLGSTWLIMKTDGETHDWARKNSIYFLTFVLFFMGLVSIWVPFLANNIEERWFSWPGFLYLVPIPIISLGITMRLIETVYFGERDYMPYLMTVLLF
ncbi:MAG: cytochrome d ubiquinol oxidase subunit II, partial [Alphaproteobacteria bacterium]